MWKKVMVGIIALVGSFTVGWAFYNLELSATSPYNIGGDVYGRVGAPIIGDRIFLGTKSNLQQPMGWVLLEDYDFNDSYLAFSTSLMDHTTFYDNVADTHVQYHQFDASKTAIWKRYDQFNARLATNSQDMKVVANRAAQWQNQLMQYARAEINDPNYGMPMLKTVSVAIQDLDSPIPEADRMKAQNVSVLYIAYDTNRYGLDDNGQTITGLPVAYPYTDILTIKKGDDLFCVNCSVTGKALPGYPLEQIDLQFSVDGVLREAFAGIYTISNYYQTKEIPKKRGFLTIKGLVSGVGYANYLDHTLGTVAAPILNNSYDIQGAIEFKKSYLQNNVVFAVSQPTQTGNGSLNVLEPITVKGDYRTGEDMKLRLADPKMQVSFNNIFYQNESIYTKQGLAKSAVAKVEENATVQLDITGNAGSDAQGVYTLSALIFDASGRLVRYIPLTSTTAGGNRVDLNLAALNLPLGEYTIKTVNESYNQDVTETTPAACSQLSDGLKIQIVEPLLIAYTPSSTTYEYQDNVNLNAVVGNLLFQKGITPYHVAFDQSGTNDYLNFAFSQDRGISGSAISLKVAANAPDASFNSLNAGTYDICMIGYDLYDEPSSPQLGKSKVCATINVAKTALSIAFDDPQLSKKSIVQAQSGWQETASASSANGTKVTYAITATQGNITTSDIMIDPNSGAITYTGNGAYGRITIQATVDDDPTTGNDNYLSATTTKEVVIYRDVDGAVTPDAQSSDPNQPVFTASDPNAKTNGRIGKIEGMLGTPDDGISGTTTYHYELKQTGDHASFQVDPNTGEIKTKVNLGVGDHEITLIVKDAWSEKEIPLTIRVEEADAEDLQFYENSASNIIINTKSAVFTDTGISVFATVKGSTNSNPVRYQIKSGERSDVISVNATSGGISILGTGTVVIEATKQGVSGQSNARAELIFTVTPANQNLIYTDATLKQELPKNGNAYAPYSEVYAKQKTFQVYTAGNPNSTTITYQLKASSPTDVIEVDSDGTIHILNASLPLQAGTVIVEATSHDPNGNYNDMTIELPITITKASQIVSFAEQPIYVTSGSGSVTPIINAQDISSDAGGVVVSDTDTYLSVGAGVDKRIAKTTDGKTILYNYEQDGGIDIPLHVVKQGNRNYELAEADGVLHILGPDENILIVSDVGEVEYGEHFMIRSLQDDSASQNVQYTFVIDDTTYLTNSLTNGNMAEFDAVKITGTKQVMVTITRTADGERPLSVKKHISVVPKPIEITIEDKQKYKGETNPPLTYESFNDQLVEWNGIRDSIQSNDVKLNTAAGQNSQAGDYPIKGDAAYLNRTYPNYSFTFQEGTLTIIEENIEDTWYHLEVDDGNHTPYDGVWTNQDVNIISDHNEYIHISLDQSTWKPIMTTVRTEGKSVINFWLKKDSGAITSAKQETIFIDKTPPTVKSIKAKDTNNKLQDIIHKLSGGIFFKPSTRFDITTSDVNGTIDVSTTESIAYKIYKLDGSPIARSAETLIKEDTLSVTDENASFTIDETRGKYKVCVTPKDQAGNEGEESCHEITLKKINVDADEDGDPDFNDPDGDGCSDLNIVLGKDEDDMYIKLNIDRNHDGIPELNIDSDGDGIADINVDQDGDGKADLNIVKITKWNPSICVEDQAEEYCTDGSLIPNINVDLDRDGRPDINLDLDQDGIPELDIDSDGDGIPDINVDNDKDGTADEAIVKLKEWKISDKVFTYGDVKFQTMTDIKIEEHNQLIDNDVIIEHPDGSPFPPNLELKVEDVTTYQKEDVMNHGSDMLKERQEVKVVYEIKLLEDGKEIEPDGTLRIRIPIPEGAVNAQLIRRTASGTYERIEAQIEDGYLVYESDELGIVAVIADEKEVAGSYYPGANTGGALTGDTNNPLLYTGIGCTSLGLLFFLLYKNKKDTHN